MNIGGEGISFLCGFFFLKKCFLWFYCLDMDRWIIGVRLGTFRVSVLRIGIDMGKGMGIASQSVFALKWAFGGLWIWILLLLSEYLAI